MRERKKIEDSLEYLKESPDVDVLQFQSGVAALQLEVLLDIRDQLVDINSNIIDVENAIERDLRARGIEEP